MKTVQLKRFLKASTLALSMAVSLPAFAAANDQIVAVVDNSVILKSDLAQSVVELKQQLEMQKRPVPPQQILEQQALEQLIVRQAQLEQVKRYNIKADEKSLNEAVLKVAQQNGSKQPRGFSAKVRSNPRQAVMHFYVIVLLKI